MFISSNFHLTPHLKAIMDVCVTEQVSGRRCRLGGSYWPNLLMVVTFVLDFAQSTVGNFKDGIRNCAVWLCGHVRK